MKLLLVQCVYSHYNLHHLSVYFSVQLLIFLFIPASIFVLSSIISCLNSLHSKRNEKNLKQKRWSKDTIAAGRRHSVGLKSDGTVIAVGDNDYGQCDVSGWRSIQLPGN